MAQGPFSLAEFAPAGANKVKSVFPGDKYVGENTSQPASVELLRHGRSNYARGGLHPAQKSDFVTFLKVLPVLAPAVGHHGPAVGLGTDGVGGHIGGILEGGVDHMALIGVHGL